MKLKWLAQYTYTHGRRRAIRALVFVRDFENAHPAFIIYIDGNNTEKGECAILNIAARATIFTFSLAQNICAVVESHAAELHVSHEPENDNNDLRQRRDRHYHCCRLHSSADRPTSMVHRMTFPSVG